MDLYKSTVVSLDYFELLSIDTLLSGRIADLERVKGIEGPNGIPAIMADEILDRYKPLQEKVVAAMEEIKNRPYVERSRA